MNYNMMIPPFKCVSFVQMSKEEAREYFDWYIGQIDHRITLLLNRITEDNYRIDLDYSVDSLISLWTWYERKISYRQLELEELETIKKNYPRWMENYIPENDLAWESLMYGHDIAMYFAEVIVKHNDGIYWGYFTKPKNRADVNEPVLLGFAYNKDLNPRLVVENCARHSLQNSQPSRLYDLYNTWIKYII